MADEMAKRKFLENFYIHNTGQAMIFVNTKKTAAFLKDLIFNIGRQQKIDLKAEILTSDFSDKERD